MDVAQTLSPKSTKNAKIKDRAPLSNKKRDADTKHRRSKKRCKSKSTGDKKWERSARQYKEHETIRRGEGHVIKLWIKTLTAPAV